MTDRQANSKAGSRADFDVYVARPVACPYLPDREEGKLLVPLDGDDPAARYDMLIANGFRRSHRWAYRPRCVGCTACVPVRIDANAFTPSRTQRRVAKRSAALTLTCEPARSDAEVESLLIRYVQARHGDGSMAAMGPEEVAAMIEETTVRTELWRLRDSDGVLVAWMLVDAVHDGLSLVYSAFAPERARDSVGVVWVLRAVDEARRRGRPHVYLGYWVQGCRKMEYKAGFSALQAFGASGWRPLAAVPEAKEPH